MKIKILLLATALFGMALQGCAKKIELKNPTNVDRVNEIVEISISELNLSTGPGLLLTDDKGKEVPCQITHDKDGKAVSVIFQASVKANATASFKISTGKQGSVKSLTSARLVTERKDDLAWENDLAAYRMYGPALKKENPSNGVDLWMKKTSELIVDTFYYNEINLHKSYHIDWGKGMDMYKVGHTLGAGGVAPYLNDSLFIWNQFDAYKVIDNGPLRSTFTLTYKDVQVGSEKYKMEITISADAGSIFNKANVKLEGADNDNMRLAAGLVLHDGKGILKTGKNWTALQEEGVTEFGVPSGAYFTAVLLPSDMVEFKIQNNHALEIQNYKVSDVMTYYFGGCYSKWKYTDLESWIEAIEQFNIRQENPLIISIL